MYKKLIAKAKKPLFIIGQGPLCSPEAEEIFNYLLSLHNSLVKIILGMVLMFFKIIQVE